MKINEITEAFGQFRKFSKGLRPPAAVSSDTIDSSEEFNKLGLNSKYRTPPSRNRATKSGVPNLDIKNSETVEDFCSSFSEDIASANLKLHSFYWAPKQGNSYSWLAGKAYSKVHKIIIELPLKNGRNSVIADSLQSQKFTMIRVHINKDSEDREKIKQAVPVGGGVVSISEPNEYIDLNLNNLNYSDAMDVFFQVVDAVDSSSISSNKIVRGTGAKSLITKKNTPLRYYMGAAVMLYSAYRFRLPSIIARGGKGDASSTGIYDIRDDLITIGITKAAYEDEKNGKNTYREHAVPGDAISAAGLKMYADLLGGKPMGQDDLDAIKKVAHMIQQNLCIVRISMTPRDGEDKTEQKILDSEGNTNPMGWTPENNNILARFKEHGIQVFSIEDGKHIG